jgi:hypothetical protein
MPDIWATLRTPSLGSISCLVNTATSHVGCKNPRLVNKRVANMNQSLMHKGVLNKFTWGSVLFPRPCSSFVAA